ncbi:MAG: excisionase [Treponema sp.]|nr:excisionase [Treponema sp.]
MDKEYILKHKNIPVLLFKLNEDFELLEITTILDEKRLPFGLKYAGKKEAQFKQLSDWIENRGLPRSRSDLANIEYDFNVKNSIQLTFGSYALNLADHYWVHKSDINLKWENVNFFSNNFKEVVSFDILGVFEKNREILVAPDLTVDGSLRKKWIINNNERLLLKGSRYDEMQEPFNELIASKIMDLFEIEHVKYGLVRNESNNMPLSVCKCMVDIDTEIVTAQVVLDTELKENRNEYDRFINICNKKGIKDVKENIDNMIIIDFLIGNTDRHTSNFGIIRNSETLEWLKVAPIFDNGNSFHQNTNTINNIEDNVDTLCRWFPRGNYEKLQYIDNPKCFSNEKIDCISNIVYDNLCNNENVKEDKKNKLVSIVKKRINLLKEIIEKK